MVDIENYIIDYERVNELTVHENDDPTGGTYGGSYVMGARSNLRSYLKTFEQHILLNAGMCKKKPLSKEKIHMVNTLIYNRILVNVNEQRRGNVIDNLLSTDD